MATFKVNGGAKILVLDKSTARVTSGNISFEEVSSNLCFLNK